MRISGTLSELLRPWRRRKPEDLSLWMEVWLEAYYLAYFIVPDKKYAKEVATEAVLRLKDDSKRRKHKEFNHDYYESKVRTEQGRRVKVRSGLLPDPVELDRLVYFHSTKKEQLIEARGIPTTDDFDVWFIKCVIQNSLKRNSLCMAIGVSSGIHTYDIEHQTPYIWEQIVKAAPRRTEFWKKNSEPFSDYWLKLKGEIGDRFGDTILNNGKGEFLRRQDEDQTRALAAGCFDRFTPRESDNQCIGHKGHTPNDNEAELKRNHVAVHQPCYDSVLKGAALPPKKIGLPEYGTVMSNTRGNGGNNGRVPDELSAEELNEVSDELRRLFHLRRIAPVSSIVIMVDGVEEPEAGRAISSTGGAKFSVHEGAQLIEVWSRQANLGNILLTSCLLSHAGGDRTVLLEGGQKLIFNIRFNEQQIGDGAYEIGVRYKETSPLRRAEQIFHHLNNGEPSHGRRARQLVSAGLAFVLIGAGVFFSIIAYNKFFRATNGVAKSGQETGVGTVAIQPEKAPESSPSSQGETVPTPGPSPQDSAGNKDAGPQDNNKNVGLHVDKPGSGNYARNRTAVPAQKTPNRSVGIAKKATPDDDDTKSLLPVNQIYVGELKIYQGEEGMNAYARDEQAASLQQTGLFQAAEDKHTAKYFLQTVRGVRGPEGNTFQPRIVTKSGKVVWFGPYISLSVDGPENAKEEADDVVRKITDALVSDKRKELENPKF